MAICAPHLRQNRVPRFVQHPYLLIRLLQRHRKRIVQLHDPIACSATKQRANNPLVALCSALMVIQDAADSYAHTSPESVVPSAAGMPGARRAPENHHRVHANANAHSPSLKIQRCHSARRRC
jgi:hypothetical protein